MWSVATVVLLLSIYAVFGRNDFREMNERMVPVDYSRNDTTEVQNQIKIKQLQSLWHDAAEWASSAVEYFREWSGTSAKRPIPENGRKLKYRKAELKFMMKTLFIFKVVLGLFLPLSVIASKILSWKAVTLSLMAFMLAKILFVKNLLSGKTTLSAPTPNFVPPFFLHGVPNDLFWRRHGEAQSGFTWAQT